MNRYALSATTIGVLILAGAIVSAQAPAQPPAQPGQGQGRGGGGAGAPQPPPTNLQVLPKDWTRQQVLPVMQQFNQALGVTCAHCHVFIANGDPMNDFATDMKPTKNVARAMMRMVGDVNPMIQKAVAQKPAAEVTAVNCAMCHRGSAIPQLPPPPGRPGGPGAAPAPGAPGAPGGAPGAN